MKDKNSARNGPRFYQLLLYILCLPALLSLPGVQQAIARTHTNIFNPNMFNITPGTNTSSQEYCDVAYNLDLDEWLVV